MSGLFFIGIGVLFLAYGGTTGLPAVVDAEQEFKLEEFASRVGNAVPDYALLAVVALVVAGVLGRIALRRDAESEDD